MQPTYTGETEILACRPDLQHEFYDQTHDRVTPAFVPVAWGGMRRESGFGGRLAQNLTGPLMPHGSRKPQSLFGFVLFSIKGATTPLRVGVSGKTLDLREGKWGGHAGRILVEL